MIILWFKPQVSAQWAVQLFNFLDYRRIRLGGRILLINGGSGSCGTVHVQNAKQIVGLQVKVIATCSAANIEL